MNDLLTPSTFADDRPRGRRVVDDRLHHAADLLRPTYTVLAILLSWMSINLVLLGLRGGSLVSAGMGALTHFEKVAGAVIVLCACLITLIDAALLWVPHSRLRLITARMRLWAHLLLAATWSWLAWAVTVHPDAPKALAGVLLTNILGSMAVAALDGIAKNRMIPGGKDA